MDDATEFQRRRNLPGVVVRHLDGGKRSMTVELKRNGQEIGSMTHSYKRGKVVSTLYILPTME